MIFQIFSANCWLQTWEKKEPSKPLSVCVKPVQGTEIKPNDRDKIKKQMPVVGGSGVEEEVAVKVVVAIIKMMMIIIIIWITIHADA